MMNKKIKKHVLFYLSLFIGGWGIGTVLDSRADSPIPGNIGGTGVNNGAYTITLGGNILTAGGVTFNGAYDLTFTLVGSSTITLPSGTKTLAANDGSNASGTWPINITGTASGGSPPSGAAGGDLGGTYPNPTVLQTNGVAFATSATTDTTNAANITSGTLPAGRLNGTYTNAVSGSAQSIITAPSTANLTLYPVFTVSNSSGEQDIYTNSAWTFNPSTGVMTFPSLTLSGLSASQLVVTNSSSGLVNGNLTGDVSTSSGLSTTLATVNLSPGTYGDGTHVAAVTVNGKGLVTSASSVAITGAAPTGAAGGDLSGNYPNPTVSQINGSPLGTISASTPGNILVAQGGHWNSQAMSGDATLGGGGALGLNTVNSSPGSFGSASQSLSAIVNGKGLTTSLSAQSIQIAESQVTGLTSDLAAKLPLAGGTMTGNLILNADPTASAQAATKNYVDMTAAGLQIKTAVAASTTANLVGTYLNGTSGVGATFTMTATGVLTLDGQTVTLGNRYLLKNQTSGFQNGIYDCTTAGAAGIAAVFTRSADYNTAADMDAGSLIPIINGTTWGGTTWLQTATITTVGTDNLVFSEFGSGPTTLTGDVTGSGFSPTSTTVSKINGNTLGSTTPSGGYVLEANGSQWTATAPAALTETNDTNVTMTLGGSASTALLNPASMTLGWTGTLAAGRLNSNVVQGVTNDTNVTGSISAQNMTLGWTGTLSAARMNFNSTNLKNSSSALNTIQDIATSSSPTFAGETITGTGTVTSNITSTTTGSRNEVDLITTRGDQANGYNLWKLYTGATNNWNVGEFATSNTFDFFDAANSVTQLSIAQGSGTSGTVTVAGEILANSAAFTNALGAIYGGTAQSSYALGDILYSSATNVLSKLSGNTTSTTKALLQTGTGSVSAAPAWTAIPTSITGTANQVNASASTGAVTLSLPQSIDMGSSPTFAGMSISAGAPSFSITATSTGSTLNLSRFVNTQASNIIYLTNGTQDWVLQNTGTSPTFGIKDLANGVTQLSVTQGSGTSGSVAVTGSLSTGAGISITNAGNGLTVKSAAVSGGTANAAVITGVTLSGGTVTVNDSFVNTSTVCYFSVVTAGGTQATGGYRVTVASGTVTVTGGSLDTSSGNVACIKGN